jgi:hypothetical protein
MKRRDFFKAAAAVTAAAALPAVPPAAGLWPFRFPPPPVHVLGPAYVAELSVQRLLAMKHIDVQFTAENENETP